MLPVNIRNTFPFVHEHPHLTFLDTAASAQKPQCVLEAMATFQQKSYANIHRGLYALSQHATAAYEDARHTVAQFLHAPKAENIIFTRNTTEAINLVAQTWAKANLNAGDSILLSQLEHHANIVPWHMLAQEKGLTLNVIPTDSQGNITVEHVKEALTPHTKLVAITHMSNALGTVVPVADIITLAHNHGAKVLIDGSQMVVHGTVDVAALDVDFYAFTGHKLYGPTGIGVLYGKTTLLENMPPYQGGGDMIETVTFDTITYAPPPARFEAGTPNIVGVIGLKAAIGFITHIDADHIKQHEAALLSAFKEGAAKQPGITLIGAPEHQASIQSFILDNIHPHDAATLFNEMAIALRAGHHCCMPLMAHLGVTGTLRASFSIYNTLDDVEKLLAAIPKVQKICGV